MTAPNTSGYDCKGTGGTFSPAGGCNAVQVVENEKVNTPFLGVIGLSSVFGSVQSKSTVLMRGGTPHPLDVMIVLDVSSSMNATCTDINNTTYTVTGMPNGKSTKLDCAKEGIRTLISTLWPCDPALATCPTPNPNPVDKVGLEIFPGVLERQSSPRSSTATGRSTATPTWGIRTRPVTTQSRFRATIAPRTARPTPRLATSSGRPSSSKRLPGRVATRELSRLGVDRASPNQSKYGAEAPNGCVTTGGNGCTFFADALGNAAVKICLDKYGNAGCSGTPTREAQGVIILLSDGDANTQGPSACQSAIDAAKIVSLPPYSNWVFSIGYDIPGSGCATDGAQSEIQKLTFTGTTSGNFTLNFNGAITAPITYTAGLTTATIQTALRGLPTINGANVTVTGNNGGPFTMTFGGTLANQDVPQIFVDGTEPRPVVQRRGHDDPRGSRGDRARRRSRRCSRSPATRQSSTASTRRAARPATARPPRT